MKISFKRLVALILILSVATSCYDDSDFSIPQTEPLLVIDGWITNVPEESNISFSWSTTDPDDDCLNCGPNDPNSRVPVQLNATLKDDAGLELEFNTSFNWKKGIKDWTLTNFQGVIGRTYTLNVTLTSNGIVTNYSATSKMLSTPKIDSISYVIRKGAIGKEDSFIPLIGFTEPQNERNYYLFSICGAEISSYMPYKSWKRCGGFGRVWNFSVLSDTFLPEHVVGLSIDDGATVEKYTQFYPAPYHSGFGAMVLTFSIDLKTFNYYKSLLEQFDYDGGAYFPTPSSARGNISNGALGVFIATETQGSAVFLE